MQNYAGEHFRLSSQLFSFVCYSVLFAFLFFYLIFLTRLNLLWSFFASPKLKDKMHLDCQALSLNRFFCCCCFCCSRKWQNTNHYVCLVYEPPNDSDVCTPTYAANILLMMQNSWFEYQRCVYIVCICVRRLSWRAGMKNAIWFNLIKCTSADLFLTWSAVHL